MLEAFKIKPFDLEPVYASWATGPRFLGDPKKDPPVDDWLKEIKSGCIQRNVPQEYWHTYVFPIQTCLFTPSHIFRSFRCAQHFMGDKAKARLTELKKVMAQVHGGRYRWNWKKFKVAMRNMSFCAGDIDTSETVKVHEGPFWWLTKSKPEAKPGEDGKLVIFDEPQNLSRSNTIISQTSLSSERPAVGRASTLSFWPVRKNSKETEEILQRPGPRTAKSDDAVIVRSQTSNLNSKALPAVPEVSTIRAPAWLLNAANALDFLQNEHPRVMSTLSAILIVAGTLPTLPVISAGAGGAVLASSTAHAVGALAVGIGSWMKTQQEVHAAK
ncbi:hypothetical protein C8R43DRAFT_35912 [Mycena crocata]|nr:hypothetical protein C8R43DRAFT_35912 [Mycena crocata]